MMKYTILFVAFLFLIMHCSPGAYMKWTGDENYAPIAHSTTCGKVEIRPIGSSKGYLFQIKFIDIVPTRLFDKIDIEMFSGTKRKVLKRCEDFQSFDESDSCFFIQRTNPSGLSIWLPSADSCIIDLREVLLHENKPCITRLMTVLPMR